jgi:hypothetical protein
MLVNRCQYATGTLLFNPQYSFFVLIRTIVLHQHSVHPATSPPIFISATFPYGLLLYPEQRQQVSVCFLSLFNDAVTCFGYVTLVLNGWMSTEHWWNDTNRRTVKYWQKTLLQCYFGHHKSLHVLVWD